MLKRSYKKLIDKFRHKVDSARPNFDSTHKGNAETTGVQPFVLRLFLLLSVSQSLEAKPCIVALTMKILRFAKQKRYPASTHIKIPRELVLDDNAGHLHLAETPLNAGRVSLVYRIESSSFPLAETDKPFIAKVLRDPKYEDEFEKEVALYKKNEYALQGRVVPVQGFYKDSEGRLIIVKPESKGTSLVNILVNRKLSASEKESLQNLLDWTTEYGRTHGLDIDINPFNLFLASDPVEVKDFGLEHPSILFYEFTEGGTQLEHMGYRALYNKAISGENLEQSDFDIEGIEITTPEI